MRRNATVWVLAIALVALACGDDRAGRYAEARKQVEAAEQRVTAAEERVKERESALEKSRAALDEARSELDERRRELREAQEQAAEYADDTLIFRTLQQKLLEERALRNAAVAVAVDQGAVTLIGTVPSKELRDRAIAIARDTPGVVRVESELEIAKPEPKKRAKPASEKPDEE